MTGFLTLPLMALPAALLVVIAPLPPAEMLAKLRDPEMRRTILAQEASPRLL